MGLHKNANSMRVKTWVYSQLVLRTYRDVRNIVGMQYLLTRWMGK